MVTYVKNKDFVNSKPNEYSMVGGIGTDTFVFDLGNADRVLNFGSAFGSRQIAGFVSGEDKIDLRSVFERLNELQMSKLITAFNSAKASLANGNSSGTFGVDLIAVGANAKTSEKVHFDFTVSSSGGEKSFTISMRDMDNAADKGATITLSNIKDINWSDFLREEQKVFYGTESNDAKTLNLFALNGSAGGRAGPNGALVYAYGGNDLVIGSAYADKIFGGTGNDTLVGNRGDDQLWGEDGDDTLEGGEGNDTLYGGSGKNTLRGEGGDDVYVIDSADDVTIENANEGIDTVISSLQSYALGANVENLTLSGHASGGTGNELDNIITGNSGSNWLTGGAGADTMIGGAGDDVYYVDDIRDIVVERAGEGIDFVFAQGSYKLGANVEKLQLAGSGLLSGTGNELNNTLYAGPGGAILDGGLGDDTLSGGAGNDRLIGGQGNDTLQGRGGKDWLSGGAGNDTLSGQRSQATFVFELANIDRGLNFGASIGRDIVTDFHTGTDKIDLHTVFERMNELEMSKLAAAFNNAKAYLNTNGGTVEKTFGVDLLATGSNNKVRESVHFDFTVKSGAFVISMQNKSNAADTGASITLNGIKDINWSDFLREEQKVFYGTEGNDTTTLNYATLNGSAGGRAGPNGALVFAYGGNDFLTGSAYNDTLFGGAGSDVLTGNRGDDELWGEDGNDLIDGSEGNDVIYGGTGGDTLWGGADRDTFVIGGKITVDWSGQKAVFEMDAGAKIIKDFVKGQDIIRVADTSNGSLLFTNALKQPVISAWLDTYVSKNGTDLVISGDNNGAAAGGEFSYTIKNVTDSLEYIKAHASEFFSFG